ncbi:MAG: MipA/OmpV family protein [Klebsiella michiganensis]|nr:MipA/OmpV family protein [Klebsiella michiganensis]
MIARKISPYMVVPFLMAITPGARADEAAAPSDGLTIGVGGKYAPRYSGSDKQIWQVVPVLQGRKGAFFIDSQKGIGYDLSGDSGLYFEHTLGYDLGRAEKNSSWRDGANTLKGMGNIKATMNTAFAHYQTSVTLLLVQNPQDIVALQSAALFGDSRYVNTFYGVDRRQSIRSGYRPYRAAGGFYGIDSALTWSHQYNEHWGSILSAGYSWLGEHAAESPLVSRRNEGTVTAAITWTF